MKKAGQGYELTVRGYTAAQLGTDPCILLWEQLLFWFLNHQLNTDFLIIHKIALVFGREMD